jgi:hypothetical protein
MKVALTGQLLDTDLSSYSQRGQVVTPEREVAATQDGERLKGR